MENDLFRQLCVSYKRHLLGLDLVMLEWLTGVDIVGVAQARPPADSCFQSVIIQLRRSDSAVRDEKSVS